MLRFLLAAAFLFTSFFQAPDGPAVGDVVVSKSANASIVEFTLISATGYVHFAVPGEWSVIAMQSKPPVTVTAFQVANAADQKTADSSNAVVSVIDKDTEEGKRALSRVGKSYEGKVEQHASAGWDCYSQTAHQNQTVYTILDARKDIAGETVTVRVAWPHLTGNAAGYDDRMQSVFNTMLSSIDGNIGPYSMKPGDVVRRPQK